MKMELKGLKSTVQIHSSAIVTTAGSRGFEGVLLGIVDVTAHESQTDEIPLLKRRSKDDERKVKGYKSRRVDKGMLQAQAVRQRRSDRFKDLDASWF